MSLVNTFSGSLTFPKGVDKALKGVAFFSECANVEKDTEMGSFNSGLYCFLMIFGYLNFS